MTYIYAKITDESRKAQKEIWEKEYLASSEKIPVKFNDPLYLIDPKAGKMCVLRGSLGCIAILFLYTTLAITPVQIYTVLESTNIFFVMLLQYIFDGKQFTLKKIIPCGTAFLGIWILI